MRRIFVFLFMFALFLSNADIFRNIATGQIFFVDFKDMLFINMQTNYSVRFRYVDSLHDNMGSHASTFVLDSGGFFFILSNGGTLFLVLPSGGDIYLLTEVRLEEDEE